MSLTITILGCGSSGGVPRVGQGWGACNPADPRNRRRRCSILVEKGTPEARTQVLVDTGPDLREQMLSAGLTRLDAILMTHAHADHTHGIDDVRPLVLMMRKRIPMHMDEPTSADVRAKFSYIFETPAGSLYPALLNEHRMEPGKTVTVEGAGGTIDALPIMFRHGDIDALGFRFGDVAYSPDLSDIPSESVEALRGLDLWIIDALRYTRHPAHISVSEALDWIDRLKPRRAILTNLHTDLDYAKLAAELPPHVTPAFDGLRIEA